MNIIKRSGQEVIFNSNKIFEAINRASSETELGIDYELSRDIADTIGDELEDLDFTPNIEYVQNLVEDYLMQSNRRDIAKTYILYREKRNKLRNQGWEMTDLQKDIYEQKYRFEGESFDEFLDRVSGGNDSIKKLIKDKKFLPAGRILAGRGLNERGNKVTYSNCFVIESPSDNLESIFDTAKKMARTYSFGGGCGTDLSNLRPNNAKVNNSAKETTGACSFADLYSTTTGLIGQRNRRGALMLTMNVNHPDIVEFINLKTDLNKVTKANISVMITDNFMKAVKNDEDWEMKFEVIDTGEIITRTKRAKDILRLLAKNNWDFAEPGALFWDKVENWHLNSEDPTFKYTSTNPCGEKPLPKGGSCLLGSVNLDQYTTNDFEENAEFNFKQLDIDVRKAVKYLDEVLEEGIPFLPLQEQIECVTDYRQIGIGIMGLSDALIRLKLRYGSQDAVKFSEKVAHTMINSALQQSALLAKEYGVYPKYQEEYVLKSPYLNYVVTEETLNLVKQYGLRNAELLSIAPTGSISTMFGVSGGIEPIFNTSYTRKTETLNSQDSYYKVFTPIVKEYMDKFNIENEEDLPEFFVTAMTLNYRERIDMQSAFQKYIDASISATVNVPNEFTVEEVEDLYMYAWEKGLKGITLFRDGCARLGILTNKPKNKLDEIDDLRDKLDELLAEQLEDDPSKCPLCGGKMNYSGGCSECQDCAYSPCSI